MRILPNGLLLFLFGGCARNGSEAKLDSQPVDSRAVERERMVNEQIRVRGIKNPRVLAAMAGVPRHEFVREGLRAEAYDDRPLPIGHGQTISQPYIVAHMTEVAELEPGDKVLEIGTGSGYQAAVLAVVGCEVYSIEIVEALAHESKARLGALGYKVTVRHGDGFRGWPEQAPFDAILVTAAPEEIPQPLIDQLGEGGRLVIPVGGQHENQVLRRLRRKDGVIQDQEICEVRFVPMTGEAER